MKILVPIKRVVDYNVKIRVEGRWFGRRACQHEDVDEPVRRDLGVLSGLIALPYP